MPPTLRPLTEADIEAYRALYHQVAAYHAAHDPVMKPPAETQPAEAEVRRWISDPAVLFLMAEGEAGRLGFVRAEVYDAPGDRVFRARRVAFVQEIGVREDARRQGVGRALMQAAADWARGEGAVALGLSVGAFNEGAIALYRELGFEVTTLTMQLDLE